MLATRRPQNPSPEPIPGIYLTCDQWCMYCRLTDRCLAFRSTNAAEINGVWDHAGEATGEDISDGLLFIQALADAEGRASPPEIAAVLSHDPERQRAVFTLDDPLERLGGSYMALATAYLTSRPDFPPQILRRDDGPTAIEVVTWYHVLAPARVFRAILSAAEAAQGVAGRHHDALCAAKVALLGIERSLTALAAIASDDADPRVELMQRCLCRLRDAVEARFPEARCFIRPGLDDESPLEGRVSCRMDWWVGPLTAVRALLHWRHERSVGPTSGDVRGPSRRPGDARG